MSETKTSLPKSMRHRRILDVAAEDPDASIEALARAVPSATPALVERVLEEYGDPAEAGDAEESSGETDSQSSPTAGDGVRSDAHSTDETTPSEADPMDTENELTDGSTDVSAQASGATAAAEGPADAGTDGDSHTDDPAYLTPVERETLRAIQANPTATQRTLAAELGVSAATVSQRVNGIEGFEWSERASFVERVFDDDVPPSTTSTESEGQTTATESEGQTTATESEGQTTATGSEGQPSTSPSESGVDTTGESVAETLQAVETQLETLAAQRTAQTPFDDPELVSKIVHACMDAETISEDEELAIIRTILD